MLYFLWPYLVISLFARLWIPVAHHSWILAKIKHSQIFSDSCRWTRYITAVVFPKFIGFCVTSVRDLPFTNHITRQLNTNASSSYLIQCSTSSNTSTVYTKWSVKGRLVCLGVWNAEFWCDTCHTTCNAFPIIN